ncbi:MAG: hypothetical protein GXP16_12990 [Gammaproteobacteria bacterium]|nr:hypothetical protein [Gammaproteobacteria bacterium]
MNRLNLTDFVWIAVLSVLVSGLIWLNYLSDGSLGTPWMLGHIEIGPFGVFVALDVMFAFYLLERWIKVFTLPTPDILWCAIIAVLASLIGSHLFSVLLYYPGSAEDWAVLLDGRRGMSSFGGILAGSIAAIFTMRRFRIPIFRGLDAITYAFVGGYVFGRAGCFAIHDHPGWLTNSFLGVLINGERRHDLGFYEMWLMLIILLLIHGYLRKGARAPGSTLVLFMLVYAPVRFLLDFLRVEDIRYVSLTPGQWSSIIMFVIAIILMAVLRNRNKRVINV